MQETPSVTVAIPTLNEAGTIEALIRGFLATRYPRLVEIFVADGMSDDGTREIVQRLAREDPRVRLIDNPDQIQAAGMNRVLERASGDLLVRADAHSEYAEDYVERCVETLLETGAAAVGGAQRFVARTSFQAAVALAAPTTPGSGGAAHRDPDFDGWIEAPWLGCFWRKDLVEIGGYESKATNEDAELSIRLQKRVQQERGLPGDAKVFYSSSRIRVWYTPRADWVGLCKQYFRYGRGRRTTVREHPDRMQLRGRLPFYLVCTALLALGVDQVLLGGALYTVPIGLSGVALAFGFGLLTAWRSRGRFASEIWRGIEGAEPSTLALGLLCGLVILTQAIAHFGGFGYQMLSQWLGAETFARPAGRLAVAPAPVAVRRPSGSDRAMRVLFIAARFPHPPLQGDRVRAYHQLRLLSRRHRLVLLAPEPDQDREAALEALRPYCERIETVSTPAWRRLSRLGRAPFTSLPLQTLYFFDPRFRQRAQTLLQTGAFDLIHVQPARMAPVVDGPTGLPRVLDLIDALSLNMTRRAQRERASPALFFALEARRLQRYEQALSRTYERLLVSSTVDRDALGNPPNVLVIPNGIDLEAHPFIRQGRRPNTILFSGRMGYFPNADAAVYFAREVFPLILRRIPTARFLIVGAAPTRRVRQLRRLPGVEVTGYVPRLQDYTARAAVAVAPMRAGSGTQFKVLEAMASGLPVVATPYALAGIEAFHAPYALVAHDAESLAEQVIRLLQDEALQERLALQARQLVEEKYTWERSMNMLEEVYQQLGRGGELESHQTSSAALS